MKRFLSILVALCLVSTLIVGLSASAIELEDGYELIQNKGPYKFILELTDNEGNVIDPIPTYSYLDDLEKTIYCKLTVEGLQEGDVAFAELNVSAYVDRINRSEFKTGEYIWTRPLMRIDGSNEKIENITASNNVVIFGVNLKGTFIDCAGKYYFYSLTSGVKNKSAKKIYTYAAASSKYSIGFELNIGKAKVDPNLLDNGVLTKEIKPSKDSKADLVNLNSFVGSVAYNAFGKKDVMLTDIKIEGIDSDAMVKSVYLTQLSDEQRVIKLEYDPLVMAKGGNNTTKVSFTIRSTNVEDIPCTITVTYQDPTATTTTSGSCTVPRAAVVMVGAVSLLKLAR